METRGSPAQDPWIGKETTSLLHSHRRRVQPCQGQQFQEEWPSLRNPTDRRQATQQKEDRVS